MKNNLLFDFLPDKEKNTITMKREFAADRQLVWDCYTNSEILEQWFAPEPLVVKTKTMDFREGGFWLYAMVEPNGKAHWGRIDYIEIKPIDYYTGMDGFSDEHGKINIHLPRAHWHVAFKDLGEHAMVETVVTYNSLRDLETVINMGLKAGMMSTLSRLDTLLTTLKK